MACCELPVCTRLAAQGPSTSAPAKHATPGRSAVCRAASPACIDAVLHAQGRVAAVCVPARSFITAVPPRLPRRDGDACCAAASCSTPHLDASGRRLAIPVLLPCSHVHCSALLTPACSLDARGTYRLSEGTRASPPVNPRHCGWRAVTCL